MEELKESTGKYPQSLKEPYLRDDTSFKFILETFNKSLPKKTKVDRIDVSKESQYTFNLCYSICISM